MTIDTTSMNTMKKGKKRTITGFGVFLVFTLVFTIFFYLNVKTIQVSGVSMLPTFKNGRRVLVSKAYWLVGPIKDNDIVVSKDPGGPGTIIKRVYRLGGESVDYPHYPDTVPLFMGREYRVPKGYVYLLGDNPPFSEDSRRFGPVPIDKILGKVIVYQ